MRRIKRDIMRPDNGSIRFLSIRTVPRGRIPIRDSGQKGLGFIDPLILLSQLKSPDEICLSKITKRKSPINIMNINTFTTSEQRNAESEAPEVL